MKGLASSGERNGALLGCLVEGERGEGNVLLSNGISHAAMRAYSLISLCCSSSP